MSEKSIRLIDERYLARAMPAPVAGRPPGANIADRFGRRLHDLRISVTDRCNFRCAYCMPKSVFDRDYAFLPQSAMLNFEEIYRLASIFVGLGTDKLRITGGEPLLRKHLERLIAMLAQLRTPTGQSPDLTLTTNGALLRKKAAALREAGLRRLTVSLDAIDDPVFRQMNDVEFAVSEVLDGLQAATEAGFESIKVNMVVQRGVNDDQILPMVEHFRHTGHVLRFIEFMDVGSSNGWSLDSVLPSAEVIAQIQQSHPLHPLDPNYAGEVARRWALDDGSLELGLIASVTEPFCHGCTRARLSTDGRLYNCLFATEGWDLKTLLRNGASDELLRGSIAALWEQRDDRYSALRTEATDALRKRRKIEMSYIGG
ncbi:MAG: GTP 3',8-cyclase MoaA [Betaproteobacteria bacterium]|nr:GTP 3',8-cyclase MoaA [Betaproteobacteria bacterium]NBO43337.1 GTP 3',8-cyclase MoaA [Betaproteobacteria bacterium]NBP09759.1 GTP 3',8-cyclase MoaA [Betaproteobacteria bacterium]NBP61152.1 GTP 3',8-cyclase MoaA [Betaproteobacteria bacterium]NBQ08031.1 GTP 3',8-cyclase MoaA [Betaproteobacteria bacterium]